jgi:hypothetical protein
MSTESAASVVEGTIAYEPTTTFHSFNIKIKKKIKNPWNNMLPGGYFDLAPELFSKTSNYSSPQSFGMNQPQIYGGPIFMLIID